MVKIAGFGDKKYVWMIVDIEMNVGLWIERIITKEELCLFNLFFDDLFYCLHEILLIIVLSIKNIAHKQALISRNYI